MSDTTEEVNIHAEIECSMEEAKEIAVDYIQAGIVPLLKGPPGIGKSAVGQSIASEFNLELIDHRLATSDPTDMSGLPIFHEGRVRYIPFDLFPIEGSPLPKDKNGWLLFLDEITHAPMMVQNAAYKIILDRMVGQHKLHKNVAIIAAGNGVEDNAGVEPMSTALQSRMGHIRCKVRAKEWTKWASGNGFDRRLVGYINWKPASIYTFKPDHTDDTYSCPRTLEFANRILKGKAVTGSLMLKKLSGLISLGIARELIAFCRLEEQLPQMSSILANPDAVEVPDAPDILWALCGKLADEAKESNVGVLIKYLRRVPSEFQMITMRQMLRRHPNFSNIKEVETWIVDLAADIY